VFCKKKTGGRGTQKARPERKPTGAKKSFHRKKQNAGENHLKRPGLIGGPARGSGTASRGKNTGGKQGVVLEGGRKPSGGKAHAWKSNGIATSGALFG